MIKFKRLKDEELNSYEVIFTKEEGQTHYAILWNNTKVGAVIKDRAFKGTYRFKGKRTPQVYVVILRNWKIDERKTFLRLKEAKEWAAKRLMEVLEG